jgi:hypothetical protein
MPVFPASHPVNSVVTLPVCSPNQDEAAETPRLGAAILGVSVENWRVAIGPRKFVLRTESHCGGLDLLETGENTGKNKKCREG